MMEHLIGLALASCATILAWVYGWRLARLHIRRQPWEFVAKQAAAGAHALLVWLAATSGTWNSADVAGVVFSALYLLGSRHRLHDYITGKVHHGLEDVPDTVVIVRSAPASHAAEDRRAA